MRRKNKMEINSKSTRAELFAHIEDLRDRLARTTEYTVDLEKKIRELEPELQAKEQTITAAKTVIDTMVTDHKSYMKRAMHEQAVLSQSNKELKAENSRLRSRSLFGRIFNK